ncbi:MAG: sulfur carrier protein [Gammaproteobacteria bacterium]|nr:MAG: sulfur carrier protein [Gammaproteobacteria bacterium]TND02908.1 MAG: sulfur carrier protein [Gammaproteobacteria bacterium]
MEIIVNGEKRRAADGLNLAGLLDELGFGEKRVAVELNLEILPRDRHAGYRLRDGDRLEIVQAIGGGAD